MKDELFAAMKKRKTTWNQAVKIIGIAKGTLSYIKNGHTPIASNRIKIQYWLTHNKSHPILSMSDEYHLCPRCERIIHNRERSEGGGYHYICRKCHNLHLAAYRKTEIGREVHNSNKRNNIKSLLKERHRKYIYRYGDFAQAKRLLNLLDKEIANGTSKENRSSRSKQQEPNKSTLGNAGRG